MRNEGKMGTVNEDYPLWLRSLVYHSDTHQPKDSLCGIGGAGIELNILSFKYVKNIKLEILTKEYVALD